ncbi:myo-inositol 2-dehydrogenase [Cohaesibacter sp. ES.047]|nr:myo-inositol 2-dehydrogenase [Cohaesibacter sp. ES.047]
MISIGLIGAGRIGKLHAANIAQSANTELVAVTDFAPEAAEALAGDYGIKAVSAEDLMADPAIDAIFVCSSTDTHADYTEMAVKAGKHVFCEKPVDMSSDRIRACLKVVEASGKKLMIGFNRRFDPNFAAVRARIEAGEIGDVELVTITSRDPSAPPVEYVKRSGGLFRDMMIHDLDMARFLLGEEPVTLFARGSSLVDAGIGEAGDVDTAVAVLETASGKICQISNSRRATYGYDQRIEVHGSKGMLSAGNCRATTVTLANSNGYQIDPSLDFFLERYGEAFRKELEAFVKLCEGEAVSIPTGEDGLKAQLLADAATESVKDGSLKALS